MCDCIIKVTKNIYNSNTSVILIQAQNICNCNNNKNYNIYNRPNVKK